MKKNVKIILSVGVAIIILVLVAVGITYGKYAYNSIWNSYLVSKSFYFESDKLDLNGRVTSDNLWDGSPISFNLFNYTSEEDVSGYDINYDVTCEVEESSVPINCNIEAAKGTLSSYGYCINEKNSDDVTDLTETECESSGYKWRRSPAVKNIVFSLESSEFIEKAKVKITARSITPYRKTLTGTFILNKDQKIVGVLSKEYHENDVSGDLVISSSFAEDKCVTLKWNADNLRIDIDKEEYPNFSTDEKGYINELSFNIKAKDSLLFTFYKNNKEKQNAESFVLDVGSECQ